MNIMLISQCNKKALVETRRIIDQFAERRGDRTWQTPITQIGLTTLRKLLKKTARRNTAVACHWIRSKNHTEILWIVGNASKFNEQGAVPTNITGRDILRSDSENSWHTAEDIALLSGIAALFHDFGKANVLFQNKLKPNKKTKLSEPYRHEWVSLRMFEAFVYGLSDKHWLTKLSEVSLDDNAIIINNLVKDHPNESHTNPFFPDKPTRLPPTARAIAWLILTHHKLPQYDVAGKNPPDLDYADEVLDYDLTPAWNSPQIANSNEYQDTEKPNKWTEKELKDVWDFKNKTPIVSAKWRYKAQQLAKRALNRPTFLNKAWLDDTFTLHLARLALMLADHHYSSLPADERFWDKKYKILANTDRETGQPKQHLDEHLIGVYRHSLQFVRLLPALRSGLSAITRHQALNKRSANRDFSWQDKAYDVARSISEQSRQQGFFGINMASTGKGKTFANAKIMYGLSDTKLGCRFNIALGLRTLTLQTGDALKTRLKLDDDDLAVLIGSQSVKQLYDLAQKQSKKVNNTGSESQNDCFDEDQYVTYDGALTDGPLKNWLEKKPKLNRLVSAPVLVSTIDHIMPATESDRGGKQIAPMLRLLTSDLVLDEIDDFDLLDLPAICRLVNWAGLLGARVLLSSATLPPALVTTLFNAYLAGRKRYNAACGSLSQSNDVCCGWFDEFQSVAHLVSDQTKLTAELSTELSIKHSAFVDKRISKLVQAPAVRQAKLVDISLDDADDLMVKNVNNAKAKIKTQTQIQLQAASAIANRVYQSINELHQLHGIQNAKTGQTISIGVVRMANIKPLVAVASNLLTRSAPADHQIHYCVYHSKLPLIVRSKIEEQLDSALRRDDPEAVWQIDSIKQALKANPVKHHSFVVLASPVCEVGRDHDYDWAVVEPSSMRSIIQLAGRVQRHRNTVPEQPNLYILKQNFKALTGQAAVFSKPGFETHDHQLNSKNLEQLLSPEQYQIINAVGRIKLEANASTDPADNLVAFEHQQLANRLSEGKRPADIWWNKPMSWSYEWQRRTRFRQSAPSDDYVLKVVDDEGFVFHQWVRTGELKDVDHRFVREQSIKHRLAQSVSLWGRFDYKTLIEDVADEQGLSEAQACILFGSVSLEEKDLWFYDEVLGFYQPLK